MIFSPIEILLVEDDPGDVELTRDSLEDSKLKVNPNVVEAGIQPLDCLSKEGQYENLRRPG